MKRNSYQRQLSEYLDGEIGLADKQGFEEALRRDQDLRAEYHAQRRLGLLLSAAMPEVKVHATRFRARLAHSLDHQSHSFLTPQRAFTAAMAIALVVLSLTFGLYIYHERLMGSGGLVVLNEAQPTAPPRAPVQYFATLVIEAPAESFYDRLLLEGELGLADGVLVAQVVQQAGVLEGATCVESGGLRTTTFPGKLPTRQQLTLTLAGAQRLQAVADSLTGQRSALALTASNGQLTTQQDYLLAHPAGAALPLQLIFQQ
jgi:hypothetical protein